MDRFRVVNGSHTNIKDRFKHKIRKLLEAVFLHDKVPYEEEQEHKQKTDDQFLDETTGFFDSGETQWAVLLVDREVVTVATYVVMTKDIFVFNVCTHPSYRHRGYAKYLLYEIQKIAVTKHNINVVKGNVDKSNTVGLEFYEKLGAKRDTKFGIAGGGGEKDLKFIRLFYEWDKSLNEKLPKQIAEIQRQILDKQAIQTDERFFTHVGLAVGFAFLVGLVVLRNTGHFKTSKSD